MLGTLKNFCINRVLRHVADNAKVNHTTNGLALAAIIYALLGANINWMLIADCCAKSDSTSEVIRLIGIVLGTVLLYFSGKFPWLSGLLPMTQDILAEAEKELTKGQPPKEKK